MNSEQAIIFASSLISKLDNINILDTVKKELPKTRCFTQTQRKSLEVNIKIINKMKTDDEFIDFLRYTRDIYFEDKGYLFHENDIEFDIEKYDLNYEEIYDLIYPTVKRKIRDKFINNKIKQGINILDFDQKYIKRNVVNHWLFRKYNFYNGCDSNDKVSEIVDLLSMKKIFDRTIERISNKED